MTSLKVKMLGKFCVQLDGEIWLSQESLKTRELFCYLLTHPAPRHRREHLAEMLWSESSTSAAKKYLRQALWQLQSKFAANQKEPSRQLFSADTEWLSFHPDLDVWTDVREFEQACETLRDPSPPDQVRVQDLKQAVQLYQGDFLEGWYQDWCLCERERLQNQYLTLLDKLIGYCEENRQYELGIVYSERLLQHDSAGERAHQQMMRLKHLSGDRTGALRQYECCVKALRDEFGVQPGRSTRELYEAIRSDQILSAVSLPAAALCDRELRARSFDDLLSQLRSFQQILASLQQQAQQWIRVIEQVDSGSGKD